MSLRRSLLLTTVALGCAIHPVDPIPLESAEAQSRAYAAEDLRCAAAELSVHKRLGLWWVSGCGRTQRYALACGEEVVRHGPPPGDPHARGLALLARINGDDLPPPARRLCGYKTLRNQPARPPPEPCRMTHVLCEVDEQGNPRDCGLVNANAESAEAMLELAYSSRFEPARQDGVAVRSLHSFTMNGANGGPDCLRRTSYVRRRR